ncbi:parallel beta helix pectate lyase-like protein [Arcicella aurantiaca]|uniref:Parallel beta helix pectate lyase-like protein n=1 Tax=Arcicella aurantiaca TaxID=591202 RepID=A0A316E257_9BACT|nr:choice-of-anchor Q domain-containing protein [Arcicella aurantiaca]PWK16940.1 parallel beta helix pectate lyase-like protein [Arcicella aurantiaca]
MPIDGGGAIFSLGGGPSISNCTFSANRAGASGGAVLNDNSNATINACLFNSNTASEGGGVTNSNGNNGSNVIINNCTFNANTANYGAGIYNFYSSPTIRNSVFSSNSISEGTGSGMYNNNSSPSITNCTFNGNGPAFSVVLFYGNNSGGEIKNCIFYKYIGSSANRNNIYKASATPTLNVSYSIVDDYDATNSNIAWGAGILTSNPLFVNIADPDGADNIFGTADDGLSISWCSPAINAGDPAVNSPTTDITGFTRGIVPYDLGAYEFHGATPTVPIGTLNSTICSGATVSLSATCEIGNVAWYGSNLTTLVSTVSPFVTPNLTSATTYNVRCESGSCMSDFVAVNVSINALPVPNPSSDTPKCAGQTLTFSSAAEMINYSWSGPNSFTSSIQNPNILNVTSAAGGIYTLTVTNANNCTSSATTSITVNETPTATASSSTPTICAGNTISLVGSGVGTYAWSGANSFTSTDQSPSIANASVLASGVYTLTVTNANNCTSTAATSVTVNETPTTPTPNAIAPINLGNSVTLTATGCSGTLKWYKSLDNSLVTNPVAPSLTTNYYAKCEVTANGITCESTKSADVTVTVTVISVQILYVNATNTNSIQDGTTWATAFSDLQTGLTTAGNITGTPVEMWVASGTCKPTSSTTRTIYFNIPSGVKVYGGFIGSETSLTQRNFKTNIAILSGEIGSQHITSDNSYHVVVLNASSSTTTLDGFTVTGGYANFDAKIVYSAPNTVSASTATIETGGGIVVQNGGSPTIANCLVINNAAVTGGGLFASDASMPSINACKFMGNQAGFGSGLYFQDGSNGSVNNTLIAGNKGIGGFYNNLANPVMTNCTFSGNGGYNGGVFNSNSTPIIKNSIFWGNAKPFNDTQSVISYSIVQGGYAGVGNLNYDPQFVAQTPEGLSPNITGDYHLTINSLAIDRGDNGIISLTDKDLDENQRRYTGGRVDMGAYEFQGRATASLVISVHSGNWESNSTWDIGRVPQLGDYVIIDNNHTITLSTSGIAKNLEYRGTGQVKFNATTSKLEIGF